MKNNRITFVVKRYTAIFLDIYFNISLESLGLVFFENLRDWNEIWV